MSKRTHISSLISSGITGVYKITNPTNKKIYIGSGFNIRERWGQHCRGAKKDLHLGLYFENSLRKNGPEHFVWEVIEVVDITNLCRKTQRIEIRERLLTVEQKWLDSEQPFWWTGRGYNINPTAGSILGATRTGKAAKGVLGPHRVRKGIVMGGMMIKGARNYRAKWCRFISPDGKNFTRPNLTQFCLSRGLNKGAMANIARGTAPIWKRSGKMSTYKGWTCEYV